MQQILDLHMRTPSTKIYKPYTRIIPPPNHYLISMIKKPYLKAPFTYLNLRSQNDPPWALSSSIYFLLGSTPGWQLLACCGYFLLDVQQREFPQDPEEVWNQLRGLVVLDTITLLDWCSLTLWQGIQEGRLVGVSEALHPSYKQQDTQKALTKNRDC